MPDIDSSDASASREQSAALIAAALLLALPILLPCLVPIAPIVYFDVDPRSPAGQAPITAIGPTGAAWLHVLSVVVAGAVIAASTWAGGRVRWVGCGLYAVGAIVAAGYLSGTLEDRLQCGAWMAAGALALAAAHLVQHEVARRWLIAAVVAVAIPVAMQAVWYVLVEHPATVEMYLDNEVQTLESRGWIEGSPQHELYRRRLTDASAVGAFGLSNVLGSLAVALTWLAGVVALGVAIRGVRMRERRLGELVWAFLPAGMAALSLVTLLLTQSKGAMLTAMAGAGLATLVCLVRRRQASSSRLVGRVLPAAAMALMVLAAGAVLVRAYVGPPDTWEGERSLLFRWHYWQGASRAMAAAGPAGVLTGLGPTGFQEAYLVHKNPLNPEEVSSTHNVFVDLVVMLGIGGLAWSVMLVMWVWQGGQAVACGGRWTEPAVPIRGPTRHDILPAAALGAVLFGIDYVMQLEQLMIETALLWMVGLLGFVVTMAGMVRIGAAIPRWTMAGAFVAGTLVLMHSQIEMGFFHLSSTTTLWGLVGMAAGGAVSDVGEGNAMTRPVRWLPAAGLVMLSLVLGVSYASPVSDQQGHLASAAAALQRGDVSAAARELDLAAARLPRDNRTLRWRVQLRLEMAYHLGGRGRPGPAGQVLAEARAIIGEAVDAGLAGPSPHRLLAAVERAAVDVLGQSQRREAEAAALREALAASPYNVSDHLRLADGLWEMGRQGDAVPLYRRVLELSDLNYLDPARQLTPNQREHITGRLETMPASELRSP